MEQVVALIRDIGFPIAMCIYVLFDNKKSVEKLTEVVNHNTVIMEKILTKLDLDEETDDGK